MAKNKSFFYTEDEGRSIIVEDTLLGDDQEPIQTADARKLFFHLQKLSEKELKLQLHIVTLSDYWRKDMIPRGLRLNKYPTFGQDNEEFKNKWEAILNKCSLDLILLLIEEARKQKAVIQSQIEDLKANLIQAETEESRSTFEKKLQEDVEKLSVKLRQVKLAKFKRDLDDYSNGTIYSWGKKYNRRRIVSFSLPSTDEEEDDYPQKATNDMQNHHLSAGKPYRKDFLDTHTKPHRKRRGRPEGAGGGEGRHFHRPATRSQSRNRQ